MLGMSKCTYGVNWGGGKPSRAAGGEGRGWGELRANQDEARWKLPDSPPPHVPPPPAAVPRVKSKRQGSTWRGGGRERRIAARREKGRASLRPSPVFIIPGRRAQKGARERKPRGGRLERVRLRMRLGSPPPCPGPSPNSRGPFLCGGGGRRWRPYLASSGVPSCRRPSGQCTPTGHNRWGPRPNGKRGGIVGKKGVLHVSSALGGCRGIKLQLGRARSFKLQLDYTVL